MKKIDTGNERRYNAFVKDKGVFPGEGVCFFAEKERKDSAQDSQVSLEKRNAVAGR